MLAANNSAPSYIHTGQFCAAFYHTNPSAEANNPSLCLDPDACVRKPNVVCIARLQDFSRASARARADPTVYIGRYTNCYRGYTDSLHAEQFMMADPALDERLEQTSVWIYEGALLFAANISCNYRDSPYKGDWRGTMTEGPRLSRPSSSIARLTCAAAQ